MARDRLASEGEGWFLSLDPSIRLEYAGSRPVRVVPSDIVFEGRLSLDAGGMPIELFEAPSPHTDDATLVYLPGEKMLFLGDSISGVFPTWKTDPVPGLALLARIGEIDAGSCLFGHWPLCSKEEILSFLKEECGENSMDPGTVQAVRER